MVFERNVCRVVQACPTVLCHNGNARCCSGEPRGPVRASHPPQHLRRRPRRPPQTTTRSYATVPASSTASNRAT